MAGATTIRKSSAVAAKRALAIAEAIDFRRAADLYHLLAETERKAGHPAEAIAALDRSVELLARTRLNPGLGLCHLVRAQELGGQGAIAEAIDHAQRAMGVCGDEALCELADLYRRARRFDEAQRFAQQAHDDALGQRAGDKARRGRAVRVLGQIAADSSSVWKSSRTSPSRVSQPLPSLTPIVQTSLEQTSLERAEELLRSSADLYARAGDALEVAETLRILGRFLADHGRMPEALSCFDQACATVLAPRRPRS